MNFIPAQLVSQDGGLAVRLSDGALLSLPADRGNRLSGQSDKEVTLGIRPEHISRASDNAMRPGVVCHEVTIDLVQPTGSRTYATFLLGGVETVAELKAHDVSAPNEKVKLAFDMNRVVLVDPESERVL